RLRRRQRRRGGSANWRRRARNHRPLSRPRRQCPGSVSGAGEGLNRMGDERPKRSGPPGRGVRALIALICLVTGGYGVVCFIRGRLVTENIVLQGTSARVVGAMIAALAVVTLVRTFYPRRTER